MNRLVSATAAALVPLFTALPVNAQNLKQQLVGTWKLTSGVEKHPDGKAVPAWSAGSLMLDAGGNLGFFLVAKDRQKSSSDPRVPVGPYVALFGTYTIDEAKKVMTYHVEHGASPLFDGGTREQAITLNGDVLSLTGSPVKTPQGEIIPVNEFKRVK